MPKLTWDQTGERLYSTGVSKGVLFPYTEDKYGAGVAWNGLTKVSENPSGAEPTALWADNGKYLNILSAETFAATISAYMYPDEFKKCIGEEEVVAGMSVGQQDHQMFGFSYQTIIGNDTKNTKYGYQMLSVFSQNGLIQEDLRLLITAEKKLSRSMKILVTFTLIQTHLCLATKMLLRPSMD